MGGSQKSKRVSWASDVNLCQVRLFISEEPPSLVGLGIQDHLQSKPWSFQVGGVGSDENLPPGFEGIMPADPWAAKLSQVSLVKWKCPPRFKVESSWRVVAGEESRETETQNQREMRVLEAIYPRPSAIPLNPCALVGVEDSTNHDHCTPVIPITPIEDEDASMPSNTTSMSAQQQHSPHGTFSSRANASLSSVMSNSDQGNLIDRELLVKILSDPKMIEQLIASHAASPTGQNVASSCAQSMPPSSSTFPGMPVMVSENMPSTSAQYIPSIGGHRREPLSGGGARPEMAAPPVSAASGPFLPSVTKDISYYKSLIQQHGGERRETMPQIAHQDPSNNTMMKPRDSKPKIMKPCIYFNSSRGCRNGASCAFQHGAASQQRVSSIPEVQGTKRMKLDTEITGA